MPVKKTKSPAKKAPTKTKKSKSSTGSPDVTTHKVINFIDQAAGLLKKGVKETSSQTQSARKATRKKALTLLGQASKHLNEALDEGTAAIRKGLRKL